MLRTLWLLLLAVCLGSEVQGGMVSGLDDYLPGSGGYQSHVPVPEGVLGFQVGEWHARPEQITEYFRVLAAQSDRVVLIETGRTYEKRPLLLAMISAPSNIQRLEELRLAHLAGQPDAPMVTWLGHSVHGNEASGSNAAMLTAYHFASAKDAATVKILQDQIILIDPMVNPDGLARFAHWANMYRSKRPVSDPDTAEHREAWPGGRTNHYWFDLNRDWLPAQHPESQARLTQFHRWHPHVLTDHHEMGSDKTFFFQPGVESRTNPLTPSDNYPLTTKIGTYHASALDKLGSLYYSRQGYDDFYYGKGSTYPDVHGSIGILFEQAAARGHVRETPYGKLTFPFAIRNHLTTALSTVEAVQQNQLELKRMRATFAPDTAELARNDKDKAIVFYSKDNYRMTEMQRILDQHQISYADLGKTLSINREEYPARESTVIPLGQAQYRLIKSMFEIRKSFKDNVFYDVSAWNFGLALDLNFSPLSDRQLKSAQSSEPARKKVNTRLDSNALAVAFDWQNFGTVQLLSRLLREDVLVLGTNVATRLPTSAASSQHLSPGSIFVPFKQPSMSRHELFDLLKDQLIKLNVEPVHISSGLALEGVDLGSPDIRPIKPVKPLLIIGDGVRPYDAGEVWHFLDQRLDQALSMMTSTQLEKYNSLDKYTHLLITDGTYKISESKVNQIADWVKAGGIIVATSRGADWLSKQEWTSSTKKTFTKPVDTQTEYARKDQSDAEHVVGGAIASARIDVSHPLGFGLDNEDIAIFKRGPLTFSEPREAFVSVARFSNEPHAAGYMSEPVIRHIAGGTSIFVQRLGRGRLIAFSDNPLFRAFWLGSARVYANALYYGSAIDAPVMTRAKETPQK